MFHPNDDHCFLDTYIIISAFHLMFICLFIFLYMLYLCLNILVGLKALKILSVGNTKVNVLSPSLKGLSYGQLLSSH